jgi:hypothetical protein
MSGGDGDSGETRRTYLHQGAVLATGTILGGCVGSDGASSGDASPTPETETVTATETVSLPDQRKAC